MYATRLYLQKEFLGFEAGTEFLLSNGQWGQVYRAASGDSYVSIPAELASDQPDWFEESYVPLTGGVGKATASDPDGNVEQAAGDHKLIA